MASRRLQVVLDLDTGAYTGRMTQAASQTRAFSGVVNSSSQSVRQLGSSFNNLNSHMSTPLQKLRDYVLILGNIRLAILNVRDIAVGWVGALLQQSAQVERLTILMKGLSTELTEAGRSKEASNNLRMLFDMARKTGFQVDSLADSFVKMRSGGIDPTNGSLQSLADAVAYFGGTSDVMHRASIAIQQMSGKGVVSMEELRQQLGEAVPTAMADMARAAGMALPEFTKLVSKGVVQAGPALQLMFQEFDRLYAGAGQRMANTLSGQMAQFKTNITELSTYFTGLASGTTAEWSAYVEEQQKLLEEGKITISEFDALTKKDAGLFGGATEALRQINEAMRSSEGRKFAQDMGTAINSIMQGLMAVGGWIVRWRNELTVAFKVIVGGFLAIKAVNIFQWIAASAGAAITSMRSVGIAAAAQAGPIQGVFANLSRATNNIAESYKRLDNMQQARIQRTAAEVQSGARKVELLSQEANRLRQLSQDYQFNATVIDRQRRASEAALAAGRQSGRYRDFETGTFISQNRALEINRNLIAAGTRTRVVAAANSRALTAVEAQLTAAVSAQTAAVSRQAVATTAQSTAQRVMTLATTAGAGAVRILGTAVNMALGPIGLIALALYTAAEAAGVFESRADRAAEAAARLRQGMGDLADIQRVQGNIAANNGEIARIDKQLREGGVRNGYGQLVPFAAGQRERLQQRRNALASTSAAQARDVSRGQGGLRSRNASQAVDSVRSDFDQVRATNGQQERSYIAQQEQLRRSGDISQSEYQRRVDARRGQTQRANTQYLDSRIRAMEQGRAKPGLSEDGRQTYDLALQGLYEMRDAAQAANKDVAELRGNLTGPGKPGGGDTPLTAAQKEAKRLQTEIENARESYDDLIGQNEGTIAQLGAEIGGAEGALAEFEARLKNNLYPHATAEQIEKLRVQFAEIDRLNSEKDWGSGLRQLRKEVAQTTAEANGLWRALMADNTGQAFETHQRVESVRSRFADKIEAAKGDPARLAEVNAEIDAVINNLNRIDAAVAADGWRRMTEEIQISLLDENAQREANFQLEVERQRRLLGLIQEGTAERQEAESRFFRWREAMEDKLRRDNESQTVKMARDWAMLGQNIQGSLAGALSAFVDGMGEAEFNFGEFGMSIVKELLKIIIKAMIAYAILSAIGMTNNAQGKPVSFSSFVKGQIGAGFGGGADSDSQIGFNSRGGGIENDKSTPTWGQPGHEGPPIRDQGTIFDAVRHHTGGWLGRGPLKAGEVPFIGLEDEVVLTKDQQAKAGELLRGGAGGAPNVAVNIINNSGTQLDAEQGEPEFNGRDFVVNVVVEAAQKQGPLRDTLSQIAKG